MAIKADDINQTFKRIQAKINPSDLSIVTATFAAPMPALMTELGPLTDKVGTDAAVDAALLLLVQIEGVTSPRAAEWAQAVSDIVNHMKGSTLTATNATTQAAAALQNIVRHLGQCINNEIKGMPKAAIRTPVLIRFLDFVFVKAICEIPIVGDAAAGIAEAATKVFIDSFTSGTKKALWDDAVERGSGLMSILYHFYINRDTHYHGEALDEFAKHMSYAEHSLRRTVFSQNALTQNQVVSNVLARRRIARGPAQVTASGRTLRSKLKSEGESLKEFYKKVDAVFNAYSDFLIDTANSGVVESFLPMIVKFENRLFELQQKMPQAGPGNWLKRFEDRNEVILALLIMGYYFNRLCRHRNDIYEEYARQIGLIYQESSKRVFLLKDERNATRAPGTAPPKSTFSQVDPDAIGSQAIIKAFKDTMSAHVDRAPVLRPVVNITDLKTTSITYITIVKNAVVNELAQEFVRGNGKTAAIEEVVKLTLACSLIVNDVVGMAAMKQQSDIKIDERYINVLEELGFLTQYTKFVVVTSSKKAQLTGSGVNAKLRYPTPGKLSTSASTAERTMVYMFAACTLAYVDIGKIVMGYQDWDRTKEALHLLIHMINEAEKD